MNAVAPRSPIYVRNLVFGAEDSLVSTVGLLSGVSAGGMDRGVILLTGMVLILVEAFSMGVGSFLSEESAEEYVSRRTVPGDGAALGGVIMFISYFVAGFVPLGPYILLGTEAFWVSIVVSLVALFLLGALSAKFFGIRIWHSGLRMLILGGLAVLVGMAVGEWIK